MLTERTDGLCRHHAPERAQLRSRAASRGARGRVKKDTAALKTELQDLRKRVDDGDLDPTKANTIIRAISAEVDVVKLERQIHLEDELEVELEELKRERSNPA
jgi:hypothetical protein